MPLGKTHPPVNLTCPSEESGNYAHLAGPWREHSSDWYTGDSVPLEMELVMWSQVGMASLPPAWTPIREEPQGQGDEAQEKEFPKGCPSASGQDLGTQEPSMWSLGELCWGRESLSGA